VIWVACSSRDSKSFSWPDQFGLTDFVDHSLLRLQSVAGDAEDDAFISRDPSAFNQFLRTRQGDPPAFSARCFGFGKQLIASTISRSVQSSAVRRSSFIVSNGIVPVSRGADRERLRDGVRFGDRLTTSVLFLIAVVIGSIRPLEHHRCWIRLVPPARACRIR